MIALTHVPSPHMQSCVRTFVDSRPIDYALAKEQHAAYCQALHDCGAEVITLDFNARHADCAFIEDTAIVLNEVAIRGSLAPPSRREEAQAIEPILQKYREVAAVEPPVTLEGGDVLRVGRTLLVGQSCRTNAAGIAELAAIAQPYGYQVVGVPVHGCLHLKTACTALPDGGLLINPAWIDTAPLAHYRVTQIPDEEPWAANVALVGHKVMLPAAHQRTADVIRQLGFETVTVDVSEFAKAEGGVTCLSLFIS